MKTIIDNTKFIQCILKEYFRSDTIAVDMTCGNGLDSLFLAKYCQKVYCFDIQKEAINKTRVLLKENSLLDKCELICDSHVNIDKYINEKVDMVIYNLGYLPHSNQEITTNYKTTICSLEKVLNILKKNSLVCLSIYWGHEQGKLERKKIIEYVSKLSNQYHVAYYAKLNQRFAPEIIFIEKVKDI